MSNSRRPSPFSIRLSADERAQLLGRSGGLPLAAYVKAVLFAEKATEYRKSPRSVSPDRRALGRALAVLGASHLASNLNQIAKAANQGALPVTEELEADLRQACASVQEMRALLLAALGVRRAETTSLAPHLTDAFRERAEAQS